MRYLALPLLLAASPAFAADQFDLVCRYDGASVRYRVDLKKGEACADTCDRVWKMGPSTTGELKIIDRVPAYRGDLEERATINRITGEYRYQMQLGNLRPKYRSGNCEAASFSGFPSAKF